MATALAQVEYLPPVTTGMRLAVFPSVLNMCVPQLRAGEICALRAQRLMRSVQEFSPSYNQLLLMGSADYCVRVLNRLDENLADHKKLLRDIREFVSLLEDLARQYEGDASSSFGLLNLRAIEDRFELLQEDASRLGVFPRLQEATLAQLTRPE
jgi:hypothetical protein